MANGNPPQGDNRQSLGRQRPPLHHRCLLPALAVALALLLRTPAGADDLQPVRVYVPEGLFTAYPWTQRADDTTKYITLESVRAINPSSTQYQMYSHTDFHLIAYDPRHRQLIFYPIVRPTWKSLDFHWTTMALPRENISVTVTFQVPNYITEANFEFTPGWQAEGGGIVDYCCLYQNGKVF
jgi:hypothetical protein